MKGKQDKYGGGCDLDRKKGEKEDKIVSLFFFNDTATTEIYTLSLHDALPIFIHTYFPSWDDIIMAYNIGLGNVQRGKKISAGKQIGRAHV